MAQSPFDYDPNKDKLSPTITFWIIAASVGMAIYLSIILV